MLNGKKLNIVLVPMDIIYIDNACTINYNNKKYKNEQCMNSYKSWIWQDVSTEDLKSSTMSGINIP